MSAVHAPPRRPRHVSAQQLAAVLVAITLGAVPARAQAQEPAPPVSVTPDTGVVIEIVLRDGVTITGYVLAVDAAVLTVRTLGEVELTLRRGDVVAVRRPRGTVVGKEFWPADPSDSRLFLGPTARVPGEGHGYFGVYELFFVSGAAGIGKYGMLAGGMSLFPSVDISEQVFYLAPKVQVVRTPYFQVAGAAFWVRPLTGEESAGLVFGGVTAGTELASFSGGLGFPFWSGNGFADEQLVMLGGELRASRRVKFITENWIVPGEDGAVLSGGFRIIFDGATIEAAAATTSEGGFLPIVNFSLGW